MVPLECNHAGRCSFHRGPKYEPPLIMSRYDSSSRKEYNVYLSGFNANEYMWHDYYHASVTIGPGEFFRAL